ncbi:J domain-containing protein [Xanthomonas sp. NCPPB 2632]|uniref:J domain-containing protein n=1 Tax=Xanthomonas sp. NCPPB 2632 TaxID=3240912 RepID=UPI0035176819
MSAADPSGYYRILDLPTGATGTEIKAAFRRKAQEYHPDKCKRADAHALFQLVNEAYRILSDPEARARYDTANVEAGPSNKGSQRAAVPEPIRCSVCGKVTAQPRYVIFYRVFSIILVTRRDPVQGVYCSPCAEKVCFKATAFTWALAWWGFPWGPIYGLSAVFNNLAGGKRPEDINARLLSHQAWYFAATGKPDIARAVAQDALGMALKIHPDIEGEGARLRARLDAFIASFPAAQSSPKLKNVWGTFRRPFFVQLAAFPVVAIAVALLVVGLDDGRSSRSSAASAWTPSYKHQPYTSDPPPEAVPQTLTSVGDGTSLPRPAYSEAGRPPGAAPHKLAYVRPGLTPFGRAWPVAAGYLQGAPKRKTDGYSQITIDNAQNISDVYVKVVAVGDGAKAFPVRQVFIPAYGKFVVTKVHAGSYDVRFQNLETGAKSGSGTFELTQQAVEGGIQYSSYELTLYTVRGGTMELRPLADDEF